MPKKKKVDFYRVAKCPVCGRFMKKIGKDKWECFSCKK